MHVPDGLLPAQVCAGGYALTGLATWFSLRQINRKENPQAEVPKAALLTAAFFLASSIHIPIPPTSVHFVLNGLMGVMLGYYAFPAILIGLFFQAVMFQHGGLTTLGVNATMMGISALLAYGLFRLHPIAKPLLGDAGSRLLFAFLSGAVGLGLAILIFLGIVLTTIPADFDAGVERTAIYGLALAHVPMMLIEGIFTVMLVAFLQKVKPQLLEDA